MAIEIRSTPRAAFNKVVRAFALHPGATEQGLFGPNLKRSRVLQSGQTRVSYLKDGFLLTVESSRPGENGRLVIDGALFFRVFGPIVISMIAATTKGTVTEPGAQQKIVNETVEAIRNAALANS
jgi:hypothetical protein